MLQALEEYFAKNFKHAGDMIVLTRELKTPTIEEPPNLVEGEESSRVKLILLESCRRSHLRIEEVAFLF